MFEVKEEAKKKIEESKKQQESTNKIKETEKKKYEEEKRKKTEEEAKRAIEKKKKEEQAKKQQQMFEVKEEAKKKIEESKKRQEPTNKTKETEKKKYEEEKRKKTEEEAKRAIEKKKKGEQAKKPVQLMASPKEKRTAKTQNPEENSVEQDAGTWSPALDGKLAQRKVVTLRKKKSGVPKVNEPSETVSEETQKPKIDFNFGVDPASLLVWTKKEASKLDFGSTSQFTWGESGGFGADPKSFNSFAGLANAAGTESGFSFATSGELLVEPPPQNSASEFIDKKPEDSGTSEDTSLLRVLCKVYVMLEDKQGTAEKETSKLSQRFAEAGHGNLHVNTYTQDNKIRARLVLRMEKTQRLVLNAPIFKNMDYQIQGDKFLRLISFGLDNKPNLYLLKFKTKEDNTAVKKKN